MEEKIELRSLHREQMREVVTELGEKPFRAKQLFQWVHQKQAVRFSEMTNLSQGFREKLERHCLLSGLRLVEKQVSKRKDTAKYLFALTDGNVIESVWMKYHHGNSVCVSSQVGCRMGCTFCASTRDGLTRNLTAGEMLSQVYEIQRETGERVSNVIVMGMGEPLDNYEHLVSFVRLLSDTDGMGISQRSITVSTCGLVEKIRDLMKEHFQITLAISLHAPNDEIRRRTMPVAKRYRMDEIFDVCREYTKETGRRVTFEYSMIRGVNDRREHAEELSRRCQGMNCHVNLIPLNEVKEQDCLRSRTKDIEQFKIVLEKHRINGTIRREMGGDIDAACGQLRKKFLTENNKQKVHKAEIKEGK